MALTGEADRPRHLENGQVGFAQELRRPFQAQVVKVRDDGSAGVGAEAAMEI